MVRVTNKQPIQGTKIMLHENKLRNFKVYGVCKTEKQEKYLGTIGLICTPLYGKLAANKTFGGVATKIRVIEFNTTNE